MYDRDSWCTPSIYLESVRKVFGGTIELDPASNLYAQKTVQAERYFTKEDNCLVQNWSLEGASKRVFLNPPYSSKLINAIVGKFLKELKKGAISQGIVLTNNSTETRWCQSLFKASSALCFLNKRISFDHPDKEIRKKKGNRQSQIFFYLGDTNITCFLTEFSRFGFCIHLTKETKNDLEQEKPTCFLKSPL